LALTWRHPNVPRYPSVSGGRRWIAVFGLLMLLLTFTRVPVAQRPDQPYSWRQFRNDAHDDYYQLRDKVRRKLHRN
jgi:hypothetical protein